MKLVPLLLLLAACGPRPDWTSPNGSSFFWDEASWPTPDVVKQEDWFLQQIESRYSPAKVRAAIGQVEVHLYSQPIKCPGSSPTGLCNGLDEGSILLILDLGSPFKSALTHEEAHWVRWYVLGDPDRDHTDSWLWSIADGTPPS